MRQFELHSCENEGHAISSHNSDFSDREKAVHLLQDFFGEENVIPVSNFAALKPLSLIKDLCKLYNVPFEVVNKYTTTMIPEVMAVKKAEPGFDAAQYELTFEDLAEHSVSFQEFTKNVSSQFPGFQNTLDVLWKQQRNVGRHAGGVIITSNTRDTMPLIKAKGGLQTPWPEGIAARHLEDFGLLKFDVLGLGTLRMFEETIRRILQKKGKKYVSQADINQWFFENLHPDNNSLDDLRVYKHVYWEGRYAGVFQFVKDNVQRFMKEMRPTSVLDIAIATSIYRPGPMGLGAHNIFLENRKNPNKVQYVHPVLKEVLGYTGGLLIFQEQLQLIVNRLSGMHLDDTDGIRKAFTKKDKSNADKQKKEIEALGQKFVQDSMAYSGISESDAQEVWKDFEKWTAYGFNKTLLFSTLVHTYTMQGEFLATKQIQEIGPGEYLRSRDENTQEDVFVEVVARHDHGELELFKFILDDGTEFTCTRDHKFRVTDGRMLPVWMIMEQGLDIVVDATSGDVNDPMAST
jgi:DNA polymerase-3 subunit alpha